MTRARLSIGVLATLSALALLVVLFPGCLGSELEGSGGSLAVYDLGGDADTASTETPGGRSSEDDGSGGVGTDTTGSSETETGVPDPSVPTADETEVEPYEVQAGVLTAGSFDDNLNLGVFRDFLAQVFASDLGDQLPQVQLGQRVIVRVSDSAGAPVADARVVITPAGQQGQAAQPLLSQTTGSDGRVLLVTGVDGAGDATSFRLQVIYPPDGVEVIDETRNLSSLEWEVTLPGVVSALPAKLDLAFVVDATGSMLDELEYLKDEVRNIAEAVSELFPEVEQRYALIVYRDQGDVYVVRTFDFTASLDQFEEDLSRQRANGGGDWPEALHLALEAAGQLSWRTSDMARVMFLIADAPPHSEFAQRTFDAVQTLRKGTVALYPVAASGVDTELEFYMRSAAFLTLSEYIFLTDDSGVGNPHAEPHIPCYHVQKLAHVMIRMIRAELSGTRVEPDPAKILRTVGNPVNGVCTDVEEQGGQANQQGG